MFNINWIVFVRQLVPVALRKLKTFAWLDVLVSQVKALHATFLTYMVAVNYALAHNSQIISLTKFLNDRFDNVPRRIYIENVNNRSRDYIYNKIEGKQKRYLYNKWDPAVTYAVGEFAVLGASVWISTVSNTNQLPYFGSFDWQFYKTKFFLLNKSEFEGMNDFIIWVPAALVFDVNVMKTYVNFYKYAGKRYTIQTY
jgi:hypothetical protein